MKGGKKMFAIIGQESATAPTAGGILQQILGIFYFLAHRIGVGFQSLFSKFFPNVSVPVTRPHSMYHL
jgi:Na+-driven multidrug efflux pump